MTTAHERTRSVIQTRMFLRALCSTRRTAGVPADVRREALRLLTHYPDDVHVDQAAMAWPAMWAPVSPSGSDAPSYLELVVRLRELTGHTPGSAEGPIEHGTGVSRDEEA